LDRLRLLRIAVSAARGRSDRALPGARRPTARAHAKDKFARGAFLFQVGFLKKLLVADSVALVADKVFALAEPSAAEAWLGALAYTFQIYFDFSGYSDMAIGLGLLFGFEFPVNFDSPYKSRSITEFWRRWHITLSTWLRDYLYIPLGGNRRGPARTYVNLAATMLLGGLWHGAAWTFVAWGAYQGAWLAFERWMGKRSLYGFLPAFGQQLVTLAIVAVGWVFFRATSMEGALRMLQAMAGLGADRELALGFRLDNLQTLALVGAPLVALLLPNSQQLAEHGAGLGTVAARVVTACAFPLAVCHLFFVSYSPFLYFQF
jgi:alginate O-acetyltransferase complex protein AlgI